MNINQSINKANFIAKNLDWWADYVADMVIRDLLRRKIGVTSDLMKSIRGSARKEMAELGFITYGRMVDMGAGNGYRKGIESIKSTREILLGVANKHPKRKPKKFYSPIAYGTLSRLYQRLVSNYQDHIIYGIRNTLNSNRP